MSGMVDATHDAGLQSWLESANDPATDFPIQNLPFGRFRRADDMDWRIGVAIGDQVLDLRRARLIEGCDMNLIMRLAREPRLALRGAISNGLRAGSPQERPFREALVPQARVEMSLPCVIGNYTDFYTSLHHATTVGKQFRPDNPLLPNYKWVPIGYHGRASSIAVSRCGLGHTFKRPVGQTMAAGATAPIVGPTGRVDYELELGFFISRPNVIGEPIPIEDAEEHVSGVALFNDWTARDIQPWEYQPLGPFLSKNFASTLSPWMVTMDALAPFRSPFERPEGDPAPLPYLDSAANRDQGAIDIELEVWIQTEAMRAGGLPGDRLTSSNYADAYWTIAQLVAHHTVNGCNLRGCCRRDGFRRIGFGECRGTVQTARRIT
jgi:fumarylacetoacetase